MTHAHNISGEVANSHHEYVIRRTECVRFNPPDCGTHARTTHIQTTPIQLAALLLAAFAFGMYLSALNCL